VVKLSICQTGSTVSKDSTKTITLIEGQIDILNRFRIDDLAKNRIIDTFQMYLKKDSVLILNQSNLIKGYRESDSLCNTVVKEKNESIENLQSSNSKLDKKLKRTRYIGIGSTLIGILSGLFLYLGITQ